MHELAITEKILDVVLQHAGPARVHRILLVVSELSDIQPLWLQRYFAELAAGTVASDAVLQVERSAPGFTCNACGETFHQSLRGVERVVCTKCGSGDCMLIRGADYVVEEIEVG